MTNRLRFVTAPFGFEPLTEFVLTPVEGADGLFSLRGSDDLRLFIIDAAIYLPTYLPDLEPETIGRVGAAAREDVGVYVVVHPGPGETTVNLAAPIIVNRATKAAVQALLDDPAWPMKEPLAA